MRIGPFQFRPKIVPTLITLILLPILISLGLWQLSRTEEKRVILQEQALKLEMPPLTITGKADSLEDIEYRKLMVTGKFLPDYHILVDNKVHQGQVGFYVVTPLQIDGTEVCVLVNRGWVKATDSREVLPAINTPDKNVTVTGIAKINTKDVVSFNEQNRLGNDWPALVRWLDIEELDKDIPYNLKPFLLLQAPEPRQDYVRDWKQINSPPEKNMSYAIQWFSLATALLLIFIFVNTKRLKKSA